MLEVEATSIQAKLSDGYPDQFVLVHNGKRVIELAEPGTKVGTHAGNTMLVGSREELEAEVVRLNLTPLPKRPRARHISQP